MGKEEKYLSKQAQRVLKNYQWPGNVRELENEMKRVVAIVRRPIISEHDLETTIRFGGKSTTNTAGRPLLTLPQAVARLESQMIRDALQTCGSNQVQTAKLLGLSRQGLIKKMKRLSIVALRPGY